MPTMLEPNSLALSQYFFFFFYSCLENPMDRGAWQARVTRVCKSWIGLSD